MQVRGSAVKQAITCTFLLHSDSNRGPRLTANSSRPKHNLTFTDVISENEVWATWYCVTGEHRGTRTSSKHRWKLEMGPINIMKKSSTKKHSDSLRRLTTLSLFIFPLRSMDYKWSCSNFTKTQTCFKGPMEDGNNERLNQKFSSVHAGIISSMLKNRLQIPFGRERSVWFISFHWCRTLFICVS